jgi:predicted acetyltransferase
VIAKLILPEAGYEQSYRAYIRELGDESRYPFPLDFEYKDFPALLARLDDLANGINVPPGFVPNSTYWLVQGGELIGVSNLRHYLNDRIRHHGGHIGLGVRPSYRGRGFGSTLLNLTIQEARKKGIAEIHVHCLKSDVASARTIVRNGGVLDSEVLDEGSPEIIQRYLIDRQATAVLKPGGDQCPGR